MNLTILTDNFDLLINTLIKNDVGICPDFITQKVAKDLQNSLLQVYRNNEMKTAGIGNTKGSNTNSLIRKDKIFWLDKNHDNAAENLFFVLIESFIKHLNRTCYAGITSYEFHYALFETGSFYKKHIDQFSNDSKRKYSFILYLNDNWKEADGGELRVYHTDSFEDIQPKSATCVFFKSNHLEHEVLISQAPRMSIAGWLKID